MNRLSTLDLSLTYDRAPIIHHLDLEIPTGQITALVGANGCGKSTLLRGLARLLQPKTGTVYLDGKALGKLSTKAIARRLGILPQSPIAPEGLTVKDLVAQGRYPHQSWLHQSSSEDETLVNYAMQVTRTSDLADRPLDTLSGGQRQRAWIAMALAQNTETLLLDEPTTFLDLAHQIEILELLQDLNRDRGRTIVMVLHDLNQACRYAHYLVAMSQGQVLNRGTPSAVMTEETIRQVFGLECRIISDPVAGTPMCIPLGRKLHASK